MNNFVIDASVAIKWYIPEPLSETADHYLQLYKENRAILLAPDLITIEVGNALWKKTRSKEITSDDARSILHTFTVFCPLRLMPPSELISSALDLAMALGLTLYDSLYLALAIAANAKLVTADSEIVKLAERSPFFQQIVLLQGHF